MSYILDAVNKAEAERQAQQSPFVYSLQSNAAVTPVGEQTALPRWVLIVSLLFVLLNVALWQSESLRTYFPVFSGVSEEHNSGSSATKGAVQSDSNAMSASLTSGPLAGDLPRVKLWQASSAAQVAIGALDFSFHVYSGDAERRTIIINGQRMNEGSQISSVLQLEEITVKGVLIRHADALVDVEILQQW